MAYRKYCVADGFQGGEPGLDVMYYLENIAVYDIESCELPSPGCSRNHTRWLQQSESRVFRTGWGTQRGTDVYFSAISFGEIIPRVKRAHPGSTASIQSKLPLNNSMLGPHCKYSKNTWNAVLCIRQTRTPI